MLEKLLDHNSLGSKDQIKQILKLLEVKSYSKVDLKYICSTTDYQFNKSFDGVISLLSWLEVIELADVISINKKIKLTKIETDIAMLIISKLSDNNELHNLINPKNLIFDKSFIIKKNGIDLKFSQFRDVLRELGFFERDSLVKNHFVIGSSFTNWFAEQGVNYIETSKKQKISLKALKNKLKQQEIAGFEAEKFVLEYELRLRRGHPTFNKIKIISEEDTGAGYDILSYANDASILLDKYIEVKSYSQKRFASNCPYFYWSSNEAKVARKEKGNYYLYIVDRDNMNNVKYKPIIINNPYEEIFNLNKWIMEPQSWLFKKI